MEHLIVERGTFLYKGHRVKFTILDDDNVLVEEMFGQSQGLPKKLHIDEAIKYQQQIKEVGYGKEI